MFLLSTLSWPIAVIICISIGLTSILVLYLIVRVRSNNRQHYPTTNPTDDIQSQMEWEDDIGLNITVNPFDKTKKSGQSIHIHHGGKTMTEYLGMSSDDEGDEYEDHAHHCHGCVSKDIKDYEHDQINQKLDHQLEWDDAAIEYGPKKV